MKIYIAGNGWEDTWIKEDYFNFHRLESMIYLKKEKPFVGRYKSFMLDSGAFTYMRGKSVPIWDDYVAQYANTINELDIQNFFELDIDSIVGIKEVERLRDKLERLTGKQPIPVWHKSRGLDYWSGMIKDYPYVAIGGIVTKEIKQREHKYLNYFIESAHLNGTKIHGLGFTNTTKLHKYRFDSVDSSSWLSGAKFGHLHKFDGKAIKQTTIRDKRLNSGASTVNNFAEWMKFSHYAENNL